MRDIRWGSASATRLRDGANAGTFASPLIPTRDAKIRTYSSLCKISILNCSKKHKKPLLYMKRICFSHLFMFIVTLKEFWVESASSPPSSAAFKRMP